MHHQPDNKKGQKYEASKLKHPNTTTHTKPGKGKIIQGKNCNLVDLPRAVRQKDVNTMHIYKEATEAIMFVNVGEWGGELRGSRLEAWMKSHKSEVAIT